MARINPVQLNWQAPTTNTDGSPIVAELSYRLMVDGVDFLDFPGSLNPDGGFSQAFDVLGIANGAHSLALKSFYVDNPELISDPSNSIDVIVGVARPNPPAAFSAA